MTNATEIKKAEKSEAMRWAMTMADESRAAAKAGRREAADTYAKLAAAAYRKAGYRRLEKMARSWIGA